MINLDIVEAETEATRLAWSKAPHASNLLQQVVDMLDQNFELNDDVAVMLTDDAHIKDLNLRFRGKDATTNVLSFPDEEEGRLGDIAISLETLQSEASQEEKGFDDHFRHLALHGILHLMGYDHETDLEAEEMESLEISLLGQLQIENPYI